MAGSNIYLNVSSVVVTPPTPAAAINVNRVTDVERDKDGKEIAYYGDANAFPVLIKQVELKRTVKIMGGAADKLSAIPDNTPCTVTWVEQDAKNGTGSGAITGTLVNAIATKNTAKNKNNAWGESSVEFQGYSADGSADPLTLVVAS